MRERLIRKKQSVYGMLSTLTALFFVAAIFLLFLVSSTNNGWEESITIIFVLLGILPVGGLALAIIGLVKDVRQSKKQTFILIGLISNLVLLLLFLLLVAFALLYTFA